MSSVPERTQFVSDPTKLGLCALGAAVILGVLGDLLLRPIPWGLSVFVWAGLLCTTYCLKRDR